MPGERIRMVRTYPDTPEEYTNPICPVCGWECSTVVKNLNGEVIGCDNCLEIEDAHFWQEETE